METTAGVRQKSGYIYFFKFLYYRVVDLEKRKKNLPVYGTVDFFFFFFLINCSGRNRWNSQASIFGGFKSFVVFSCALGYL